MNVSISVIVISYNEAEYLDKAAKSVLEQKFDSGGVEIIIADDGSGDNSISVIEKLELEYPGIIKHFVADRNDGVSIPSIRVSNNIKRALAISKAKYIAVLSADDYYISDTLFHDAFVFLEKKENRKYAAVFCDYRKSYYDGTTEERRLGTIPFRRLMLAKLYSHISTFIFRREVFSTDCLLDRYCDDVGMIWSICLLGKVKYLNQIGFTYVQHQNSVMHRQNQNETRIQEVMMVQDAFNKQKFRLLSLSRFYEPITRVYNDRENLRDEYYKKYFLNSETYNHNFLGDFVNYDSLKLHKKLQVKGIMLFARTLSVYYGIIRRVSTMLYAQSAKRNS